MRVASPSVAVAPDPNDLRRLTDDAGRILASYVVERHGEAVWADWLELADGVSPDEVLPMALRDLAGQRVSAPVALGRLLADAGGRAGRHVHVMRRSVHRGEPAVSAPPAVAGVRLEPVSRNAGALAPAMFAAYRPGHPDFEPGDEAPAHAVARLLPILSGEEIGPLLGCSRLGVTAGGRVAGAALLTDAPGRSPHGGPWVAELFRDPAHPGLGAALLHEALSAADDDGHATVGLAVTEGNPARGLYERAGFDLVSSWLNVFLPTRAAVTRA